MSGYENLGIEGAGDPADQDFVSPVTDTDPRYGYAPDGIDLNSEGGFQKLEAIRAREAGEEIL